MTSSDASDEATALKEAKVRWERAAAALYEHDRSIDPVTHRQLEQDFNAAGAEVHRLSNTPGEYVPKRDVRHEFDFYSKDRVFADGSTRRVQYAKGPLYDPETVINWRNTKVGGAADASLRRKTRKEFGATRDGDDVGHLIRLEQGVDPADARNVGMQNRKQNQNGGTYYWSEEDAKAIASEHGGADRRIEVREQYHTEKYGANRAIGRQMTVTDGAGESVYGENVFFVNTPWKPSENEKATHASHKNWRDFDRGFTNRRGDSMTPPDSKRQEASTAGAAQSNQAPPSLEEQKRLREENNQRRKDDISKGQARVRKAELETMPEKDRAEEARRIERKARREARAAEKDAKKPKPPKA